MTSETLNGDTSGFVDGIWDLGVGAETWTTGITDGTFYARGYSSSANTQSILGFTFPSAATDPRRADPDGTHTLTLQLQATSPSTAQVVEAWLVMEPVFTAWSNSYLPNGRFQGPPPQPGVTGDILPGLYRLGTATVAASTAATTDVVITMNHYALSALTENNEWDENLNIIVTNRDTGNVAFEEMSIGGAVAANAARLTWVHISVPHLEKSSYRASQSRLDICPICGFLTFREDWTYCGYHKRLECARCADPEDHLENSVHANLEPESPPTVGED